MPHCRVLLPTWLIQCGRLSWLSVSFLLHVKYTLSYRNDMSSQSHVTRCSLLPLGEFTVMIPQPHATLQGVRIPSTILKIVFAIFYFFVNAVWALTSGSFRIVSDTLVLYVLDTQYSLCISLSKQKRITS